MSERRASTAGARKQAPGTTKNNIMYLEDFVELLGVRVVGPDELEVRLLVVLLAQRDAAGERAGQLAQPRPPGERLGHCGVHVPDLAGDPVGAAGQDAALLLVGLRAVARRLEPAGELEDAVNAQ